MVFLHCISCLYRLFASYCWLCISSFAGNARIHVYPSNMSPPHYTHLYLLLASFAYLGCVWVCVYVVLQMVWGGNVAFFHTYIRTYTNVTTHVMHPFGVCVCVCACVFMHAYVHSRSFVPIPSEKSHVHTHTHTHAGAWMKESAAVCLLAG